MLVAFTVTNKTRIPFGGFPFGYTGEGTVLRKSPAGNCMVQTEHGAYWIHRDDIIPGAIDRPDGLKERFREYLTTKGKRNSCTLAAYTLNDGTAVIGIQVCHAFFVRGNVIEAYSFPNIQGLATGWEEHKDLEEFDRTKDPEIILGSTQDSALGYVAYNKFLLEDEILGKAYKNTSIEDVLTYGFAIDMDCQQQIAMTSCVAHRRFAEYVHRSLAWYKLVERGAHPRSALVAAEYLNTSSGRYHVGASWHGHSAFNTTQLTIQGAKDFYKGVLPEYKRSPLRDGYNDINNFWNGDGDLLAKLIEVKKTVHKDIFGDVVEKSEKLTLKRALDVLFKLTQEIEK